MKFLVSVLGLFFVFNFTFAYSENTTHPGLTDEIIDLFNLYYPELKISDEYKELAKNGSIDEDSNIRMMHHFYDPVYNRGIEIAGTRWQSSKDWVQDTMGQASLLDQVFAGSLTSYFGSDADHSWNRAIYEYVWGDKERGIKDLGHVLHLIEDASVPDHTRNDPHPPWFNFGSPYEAWTAQFDSEKIEGLGKSLYGASRKPVVLSDLQGYFDSMAGYSNNNFFSKDTTPDKTNEYQKPEQGATILETLQNGIVASFLYNNDSNDFFRLALVKKDFVQNKKEYFVKDDDFLVISNYWNRLSKQAVLHGAGVVKLFFDEVEKEKKTQALFNKNKSWFAKAYDATKNKIFGIAAGLYGSSVTQKDLDELLNNTTIKSPVPNAAFVTPPTKPADEASSFSIPSNLTKNSLGNQQMSQEINVDFSNTAVGGEEFVENSPIITPYTPIGSVNPTPGFGGGGNASASLISTLSSPSLSILPSSNNITVGASTTVIAPDTTPPDIYFSILECANSLSSNGCLVAKSNLSIFWSSTSTDVASYDVECSLSGSACPGFSFGATLATSTNYVLSVDEKIYEFRARARDVAGNVSSWVIISVEYFSSPVVINEVAWAGTSASSFDEWIELYNKTGKPISLNNWVLYAQDLVPYINLSSEIPANGYYLIERTDDTAVSDIPADLIAEFSGVGGGSGLSNSGEILILSYASSTIDQTVLCDPGSKWCGGSNANSSGNPSMERIDYAVAGIDSTNWGTSNYLVTKNGKDSSGADLYATPKKRNSLNYLISQNGVLSTNKTLTKFNNPYVVPTSQDFVVSAGAVLTLEPGVVIKMGDQSSMTVSGDIISSGTASDMIIFTSLYDDSYYGDTNGDGSASLPGPGSWKYLRIQNPSQNSQINYTRFKYGGRYFNLTAPDLRAMLSVYEATTTILNSIFEESQIAGLRATRFNGLISNNSFSTGTTTNTNKVGLYIYEGAPTISNNTFSNNYQGLNIELSQATSTISGSTFSDNYIGLYLTLAEVNLDNLLFSNNAIGIQSSLSTINILTPGSITFTNNTANTSPAGLF